MSQSGADPDASDARLVDAAASGDHAAFEALYYRHRDWVANLAWRFTGDRDMALDVVQEAFAYLVRRPPRLAPDGRLTTFLYPVVKHAALDAVRRRRGEGREAGASKAVMGGSDTNDEHRALRGAVDALPEASREVLLMRFVSGMSLAHIGEAIGIPLGTVKSRLHSAIRALGDRTSAP